MGQDSSQTGQADYYLAQVSSASLYYPFGWEMPGRKFVSGEEYRFGFNGQEEDPDIAEGHTTALYWQYNSRTTRRWNLDPRFNVSFSPYVAFECNPITKVDIKGDTAIVTITNSVIGKTQMQVIRSEGENIVTVDIYKMTVTDTEDPSYKGTFGVTRDAFAKTGETSSGNVIAETVNFEPRGENQYILEQDYQSGYPPAPFPNNFISMDAPAYRIKTLEGESTLPAMDNPASASINPPLRRNANEASGVLIHVGGVYSRRGRLPLQRFNNVAGSAGCFGICNTSNPNEPSNNQMTLFNAVLQQRKGDAPILLNVEQRSFRASTIEINPENNEVVREEMESTDDVTK